MSKRNMIIAWRGTKEDLELIKKECARTGLCPAHVVYTMWYTEKTRRLEKHYAQKSGENKESTQ